MLQDSAARISDFTNPNHIATYIIKIHAKICESSIFYSICGKLATVMSLKSVQENAKLNVKYTAIDVFENT